MHGHGEAIGALEARNASTQAIQCILDRQWNVAVTISFGNRSS